jgi:hypothetical protein
MKKLNAKPQERFKQQLTIKSYFSGWQTGWLAYDEWIKLDPNSLDFVRSVNSGIEARANLLLIQEQTQLDPSIKATARRILDLLANLDVGEPSHIKLITLGVLIQKVDTQLAATGALEAMLQLKQLQPAIERGEINLEASSKGGKAKNETYAEMRKHYQPLIDKFHRQHPDKSYEWLKARVQREMQKEHKFTVSIKTITEYTVNPKSR